MTKLNKNYLNMLKPKYTNNGYPVPKWIQFAETMIKKGWKVKLHRAKTTVSKYLYITKRDTTIKIRFSNHKSNYKKEVEKDCDYYVGVGNLGVITTEKLIEIIAEDYAYVEG